MTDTKERILTTALSLFAQSGYEAVSVRQISGALGMTQSALYKHYDSKRAIFDSIVARMAENDTTRAAQYEVPTETFSAAAQKYRSTPLDSLLSFTEAQFRYWTEDPFAADFRRLLTVAQYHTPAMAKLYQDYLAGGVLHYLTDLFREMQPSLCVNESPAQLALSLYAPVFLQMNQYDHATDKAEPLRLVRAHLQRFAAQHTTI